MDSLGKWPRMLLMCWKTGFRLSRSALRDSVTIMAEMESTLFVLDILMIPFSI